MTVRDDLRARRFVFAGVVFVLLLALGGGAATWVEQHQHLTPGQIRYDRAH